MDKQCELMKYQAQGSDIVSNIVVFPLSAVILPTSPVHPEEYLLHMETT